MWENWFRFLISIRSGEALPIDRLWSVDQFCSKSIISKPTLRLTDIWSVTKAQYQLIMTNLSIHTQFLIVFQWKWVQVRSDFYQVVNINSSTLKALRFGANDDLGANEQMSCRSLSLPHPRILKCRKGLRSSGRPVTHMEADMTTADKVSQDELWPCAGFSCHFTHKTKKTKTILLWYVHSNGRISFLKLTGDFTRAGTLAPSWCQ